MVGGRPSLLRGFRRATTTSVSGGAAGDLAQADRGIVTQKVFPGRRNEGV
ncbi:hypothetical protein JCM9957A_39300 [Kineosporia succinea]